MLKLFIIVLLCQTVSSKLIQKEDYNYIKQNWYSYKGQSDIDTINSEKFIGGINSFKQETILQHHYYLQSHYQLTIRIRAILSNCVNNFVVQLDDARSTIASSQMNPSLIIDMELSYFHTSQSAFFALQASGLPSCSNQNTWWGIFAIEIHVLDCQEFEDYCLPGSNSKWLLLISQLHSKLNDWKITSNGSSTQNLQGIDFEILLRHYSGTFQLQRYILIPFPTKVKFQFKLFFDNQPQEIKIMINDFQTLWPIDKFLNYFVEPGGKTWWIYNIEIDIHNHKSDQLSIILIFNDSASNKVSVLDFIVFYQEQKIALPPILGCLNIIDQNCIFCDIGWQLNLVEQKCIPICGDNKLYKDCDNDNHNANDGCYYCEFQCSSDCQRCNFGRCLEWSNIYNLDQQYYNNYEQVLDCKNNQGYFFDVLFDLCQPICGDQIKTLEEECDDGNNLFNDGCLNCKFICSDNCMNCQYGKCYECNPGFIINKFKCIPKCGDELVKADEICDDGNNIRFDGCHKCQSSCQLECINCYNSHCIECLQGWNIVEGKCEKSCGDGLVAIMSNEQCDDPLDSYCVDCSYSICQDNCSICHQNQCITCFFPFQLINEICQPICGDSIVSLQFEQCDDGNEIPFDGCHECQYSCSYGCILCEQDNICKQCEQNLFFLDPLTAKCKQINQLNNDIQKDQINSSNSTTNILCNQNYVLIQNICVNLCGNGLLNSYYEECDDGNNNGGDGCSSLCTLEEFYQCINLENQLTTCTFIKPPDFNLNSLSDKKNQTQIIELTFTKSVKLMYPSQIEEIIIFRITPEIIHQLTIVPQLNISIHLNNPIYQVFIQFQEYVENPKLEVQISKYVIQDEFNLELYNYNKSINLGNPFIISETTKQQVVSIVKFNDAMMYSLASIAGLALLTGNILMILNLLDLLQSLSYIRYMQYQFPPHLRQFLETYTKIILKLIKLLQNQMVVIYHSKRNNHPMQTQIYLQIKFIQQMPKVATFLFQHPYSHILFALLYPHNQQIKNWLIFI
ncbi:unnamed protein product [Paramecium sonneborni]|uniref:Insulin-like growth factor binding protein, N-terminal n=1 Tax=Paramecium sonneborni TaxID=65129 RepID=A0A8S1PMJ0_9CILI|nr:unnamed protein product [Paramecium sonneborni]